MKPERLSDEQPHTNETDGINLVSVYRSMLRIVALLEGASRNGGKAGKIGQGEKIVLERVPDARGKFTTVHILEKG